MAGVSLNELCEILMFGPASTDVTEKRLAQGEGYQIDEVIILFIEQTLANHAQ